VLQSPGSCALPKPVLFVTSPNNFNMPLSPSLVCPVNADAALPVWNLASRLSSKPRRIIRQHGMDKTLLQCEDCILMHGIGRAVMRAAGVKSLYWVEPGP